MFLLNSGLILCKHCWAKRVAPDADRCPNCGGNLPGQYNFPIDYFRLYLRNPWAAAEPLLSWMFLLILIMFVLAAITAH